MYNLQKYIIEPEKKAGQFEKYGLILDRTFDVLQYNYQNKITSLCDNVRTGVF